MKHMKKLFALIAICVLVCSLALVGCSNDGGGTSEEKTDFTGIWEANSIVDSNGNEDTETVESMKSAGMSIYLVMCSDGTAAFDMYGEVYTGTWTESDSKTVTADFGDDAGTLTMTFENDVLTVDSGQDFSLTFKKTENSELALPDTAADWKSPNSAADEPEPESEDNGDMAINQVVVDNEYVTMTAVNRVANWNGDSIIEMTVTNKTDQSFGLTAMDGSFTVDGKPVSPSFRIDEIAPGETVEHDMYFQSEDVPDTASLVNIHGQIQLRHIDSWTQPFATIDISILAS